jgi:hypothetical protein
MARPGFVETAPLPRWVSFVVGLLGIALCFAQLIFIRSFDLFTATVRAPGVAVWVHTPFVAPGDLAILEVGVFGGSKVGIEQVVVQGAGIHEDVDGLGKHWGGVITSKSGDVGQDTQKVNFTVPPDAPPGKPLVLQIGARATSAQSTGFAGFVDRPVEHSITVSVPVLARGDVPLQKALSGLRGLATLAIAGWLFFRLWHPVGRFFRRADADRGVGSSLNQFLAVLAIGLLISYTMAGIALFAYPLRHATGLLGDLWTTAFVLAWLVAPPYLGRKLAGPLPEPPRPASIRAFEAVAPAPGVGYRDDAAPNRPRAATVSSIQAALRKIPGARVRRSGEDVVVTRKKTRETVILSLRDEEVATSEILFRHDAPGFAIEAAHALATVLGPIELNLDWVPVVIDGSQDPDELTRDWAEQMRRR